MAIEVGAFYDGANVNLVPSTTGNVLMAGRGFGETLQKKHTGYTGSEFHESTFSLTTTDATVTPICSIPVPSGYAVTVRALICGAQSDDTDAAGATAVGTAINAAGTTALKGTPLYQIVESDASTNITITADDTTDTIRVNITGIAAQTWAWVAKVEWVAVDTSA